MDNLFSCCLLSELEKFGIGVLDVILLCVDSRIGVSICKDIHKKNLWEFVLIVKWVIKSGYNHFANKIA
ncbi:uncharacterized protein OCT59_008704 [Rhizophagus irregularis]|uniref:uncharacterized protein n=1 Tax=Rhizophagus irregularis TaxID=588596 RepID=UPI0033272DCD|nr:hypothetical protein OCT59_008704 [Rhizophagus irregularis]